LTKAVKLEVLDLYRQLRETKEGGMAAAKRIDELSSRITNASGRVSAPPIDRA